MKKIVKKFVKGVVDGVAKTLVKTRLGRYAIDQFLNSAMNLHENIRHGEAELAFVVPNSLNLFRAKTFSSKEPETLEWIDRIPRGSILWDIGANVGLYSCYAAKTRGCNVFAFEPSVFNLELLARNIHLNKVVEKVVMVPLPLTSSLKVSTLNMTSTDWGGALSTFGEDYGWDGKRLHPIFDYQVLGLSGDYAAHSLGLAHPDYIKIDVDGIEHMVLTGLRHLLEGVQGVLIEINDDFAEQAKQCEKILHEAGLIMQEKTHSDMFANAESFGGGKIWNQIWEKK